MVSISSRTFVFTVRPTVKCFITVIQYSITVLYVILMCLSFSANKQQKHAHHMVTLGTIVAYFCAIIQSYVPSYHPKQLPTSAYSVTMTTFVFLKRVLRLLHTRRMWNFASNESDPILFLFHNKTRPWCGLV